MFTGIVEEQGTITGIRHGAHSAILSIKAPSILADSHVGDSIAVNGVCLTATSISGNVFTADVMHETLRRSSLGDLKPGSSVNLERAMAMGGRFGGHIVSGHIDGTGRITAIKADDNAVWFTIAADASILRLIIPKGSITIDGISLTVADLTPTTFSVSVIPHTRAVTNLAGKRVGSTVNLENDVIGKYVERLLATGGTYGSANEPAAGKTASSSSNASQGITMDFLVQNGF